MKNKTIKMRDFRIQTHNGFFNGFFLKRNLTTRECRYILNNLLGINLNTREDCESREEYEEYNADVVETVHDWLKGQTDDTAIQEFAYDCSDEPLGLFNAINIVVYLQKHGII